MNLKRLVIVTATALLLGACSGLGVYDADNATPSGDAFSRALYGEYVMLSKAEHDESDFADSDVFAMRAIAAAKGNPPDPEEVAARNQTTANAKALAAGRARLVEALAGGARTRAPADAAEAQARYDCWAQEQEENFQPDDIDNCRIQFFGALARIETKPMAAEPMKKPEPPKGKMSPVTVMIYFGFDSTILDQTAGTALSRVMRAIAEGKPSVVSIVGHTDRAGSAGYNRRLAERRADAVADALRKAGISDRLLTIGSLGENAPAVQTGDGARELRNRRVEVTVRY